MKINILKNMQKLPGGMMLIPMLMTALINTFCPKLLQIGNPLTAMFTSKGTMTIIGILLFCIGVHTNLSDLKDMMKRGGIILGLKFLLNIFFCIIIIRYFGNKGFLGISAVALTACITSCNPGLYIALMQDCGDKIDKSAFVLMNIVSLPFIPICILNFASGGGINLNSILATCIPFMLGMLLGYLDSDIKELTKDGIRLLMPFMGFCLGSGIDLLTVLHSWYQGIILYLVYMLINWPILLFIDRKILKQRGHSSTAICCVAGLSLSVPALMKTASKGYAVYTGRAVAQLSFVVVISAVVTTALVNRISKGL